MKNTLCRGIIVSGLLSCSLTTFGMEQNKPLNKSNDQLSAPMNQLKLSQEIDKKAETSQEHSLGKRILEDLEKIEDAIHPFSHKLLNDAKQHPEVIVAALKDFGMGQQQAEDTTAIIERSVTVIEHIEHLAHNAIERLEGHDTAKNSNPAKKTNS